MLISIIIVNYNTSGLIENCILTIIEHTVDIAYEIIVVDNNSPDRDVEKLQEVFPQVKFLFHHTNAGFGTANNLGRKFASGQFLFFLNPDTLLQNNAVKEFFDFYQLHLNDLKIGALGAALRSVDGGENASFSTRFMKFEHEIFAGMALHFTKVKEKQSLDAGAHYKTVAWVSGADLFIKTAVFDEVGGFDEEIFMYYEETDLQRRLWHLGYRNYVIPTPQIIHLEGGSFENKITVRKKKIVDKSKLYYYKKYAASPFKYNLLKGLYLLLTSVKFLPKFGYKSMWNYYMHVLK